jgi:hypothetical protein
MVSRLQKRSASGSGPEDSTLETSNVPGNANSSPLQAHTPPPAAAVDDAQVAFMQRIAIDLCAAILALPLGFTLSPMVLREVFNPQQPLDMLARVLAFLGTVYFVGGYIAHAAIRCWHSRRTAAAREAWWAVGLLFGPSALQVAIYLVRQKPLWDPLVNLNILAVGGGIIRVPPRMMGKW